MSYKSHKKLLVISRAGNRAGRAGSGQQWARPKPGRAKILVAQPVLKTGLVGPNSLLKAKKIRAGRARSGHTRLGHIGPGQIWPCFFLANNLMAQPDPNSGWTGLAHRAGPILPPLVISVLSSFPHKYKMCVQKKKNILGF